MKKKYYYQTPQIEWSTLLQASLVCESSQGNTEEYNYQDFDWDQNP